MLPPLAPALSRSSAPSRSSWVQPPDGMGGLEFVALAALRATQLLRGCIPTIDGAHHRATVVAQMEVAAGRIGHAANDTDEKIA